MFPRWWIRIKLSGRGKKIVIGSCSLWFCPRVAWIMWRSPRTYHVQRIDNDREIVKDKE